MLERSVAFPIKVVETWCANVSPSSRRADAVRSLLELSGIEGHDLSALRIVTKCRRGRCPMHLQRLRELLPQAQLFSMYGMTECKRISYLPPEQLDLRPTSVGRGMPNQECWLVDEAGQRLPNGSTGELVVRGSHVMRGYWEKPAETAQRLARRRAGRTHPPHR